MEFCSIELIDGSPPELRVEGEVDLASADKLAAALDKALTTNADLVVDMGGVTFIDAAGVRVILQAAESLNGHGPLELVNAERVAWLLKLIGLSDIPSVLIREGE